MAPRGRNQSGWHALSTQVIRNIDDYQADTWTKARRIITKVEVTEIVGINTWLCVTNITGDAAEIYRGFYVKRGNVPDRCIGELKNGLSHDRLSSSRFLANGQRLLCSVLAYLLWSLIREANAKTPELKTMEATTARARLFKVGGLLTMTLAALLIKYQFASSATDIGQKPVTRLKDRAEPANSSPRTGLVRFGLALGSRAAPVRKRCSGYFAVDSAS